MIEAAATPGSGEFLGVDWGSIAIVSVTTLVATVVIVSAFSFGLRLLAFGAPDDIGRVAGVTTASVPRPAIVTIAAAMCIAIGVAGVLLGIYLVIPIFHSS